ncbi:MAG: ABC transporter ATP-binding protein [Kiritimatiellae bacterium]|nr:ABC transporter ATP-binding protein [Kiritimatiellia bacterium]MDD5522820.1 ABC transporter ATP-binding protein [Kiritimatiellia bacterium]
MDNAIEIRTLSVVFSSNGRPITALDSLNLCVPSGQVFGFIGPNGAGKTTTMHVLLGFIAATAGEARIFNTDVNKSIARQRIGYLPEHPDTYKFLTGRELLVMAGRLFLIRGKQLSDRIDEVLSLVNMQNVSNRKIATYSRGMMQRICLAQALINDPDLVILDEPTGGLDPIGRMEVRRIITDLRARGKTVFFSSHELSEVELVCDHLAILSKGRLIVQGPTSKVVPQGESLEKYFMKAVSNQ